MRSHFILNDQKCIINRLKKEIKNYIQKRRFVLYWFISYILNMFYYDSIDDNKK